MKVMSSCALAGLITAFGLNHASAEMVYYTYTGKISGGQDNIGLFGDPKLPVNIGEDFRVVFTFDLSQGAYNVQPPYTNYYGGSGYNLPPFGSGIVEINGHSQSITGDLAGIIQRTSNSLVTQIDQDGRYSLGFDTGSTPIPTDPTSVFSLQNLGQSIAGGEFVKAGDGGTYIDFSQISLSVTNNMSPVSPVPLPASLPLFGGALAAVAAAGYGATRRPWKSKARPAS